MKSVIKLAITVFAVIGIYFSIPFAANLYLNHNYNVKSESASWNGIRIKFSNVIVKGNIAGKLNSVYVSIDKEVEIDGGDVTITEKSSSSLLKSNNSYKSLIANHLKINTIYNNIPITAYEVSYVYPNLVNADRVVLYSVSLYNVLFNKRTKNVSIEHGEGTYKDISFEVANISFNKEKANASYVSAMYKGSNIALEDLETNYHDVIIRSFSVFNKELSKEKLTFDYISVYGLDYKNPYNEFEMYIEGSRFLIDPWFMQVSGNEACNTWIESFPKEMVTKELSQVNFSGNLKFSIRLFPEVHVSIYQSCRLKTTPEFIKNLSRPFEHTEYHPNKEAYKRTVGPGSVDWVGIEDFSPAIETALTTFEDPSFRKHQGVIPCEVCVQDYLSKRKKRGGSTISMQLVKNLWLTREQTLSRKIQEAFLTFALESALSKDQILEMYVNVVEFGPDVYGIWNASSKLGKYPIDLTLGEASCLVSRLPKPVTPISCTEQQQKWGLKVLSKHGKITEDELMQELVNF
jgi:hypothetical protein